MLNIVNICKDAGQVCCHSDRNAKPLSLHTRFVRSPANPVTGEPTANKNTWDDGVNYHTPHPSAEVFTMRERPQPEWFDLKALSQYSSRSQRSLRDLIHRLDDPLPASWIGNKLMVHRATFDAWVRAHGVKSQQTVNGIVENILGDIR